MVEFVVQGLSVQELAVRVEGSLEQAVEHHMRHKLVVQWELTPRMSVSE